MISTFWFSKDCLNWTAYLRSIPVIFSGILQLLNINGQLELFSGLVIWFQKPIEDVGSLSGLFNNQNYAGLWMVLVWPFCLSEYIRPKRTLFKKVLLTIITFLFVAFIFLTDSKIQLNNTANYTRFNKFNLYFQFFSY